MSDVTLTRPAGLVGSSSMVASKISIGAYRLAVGQMASDGEAPGLFSIVPAGPAIEQCVDQLLRPRGFALDTHPLIHVSHDMTFSRTVKPGDEVSAVARIADIIGSRGGSWVVLRGAVEAGGLPVAAFESVGLVLNADFGARRGRAPIPRRTGSERQARLEGSDHHDLTAMIDRWQVELYAVVSGDKNPIHVDEAVARQAGFPSVLVHGMCLLGAVAGQVVERLADGRDDALRRVSARFVKPVCPSETVALEVGLETLDVEAGVAQYGVRATSAGAPVLRNALIEIAL